MGVFLQTARFPGWAEYGEETVIFHRSRREQRRFRWKDVLGETVQDLRRLRLCAVTFLYGGYRMNIDVTLNIHYSAPKEIWDRLGELYRQMPGWAEAHGADGCPWPGQWFGGNGAPQRLTASVEPGGLQLYGELPEDVWTEWIRLFTHRAEEILGYPVGAVEDGFPCRSYDDV